MKTLLPIFLYSILLFSSIAGYATNSLLLTSIPAKEHFVFTLMENNRTDFEEPTQLEFPSSNEKEWKDKTTIQNNTDILTKKTPLSKKKKPSFFYNNPWKWQLFSWLNSMQASVQWAYALLNKDFDFTPSVLKEYINDSFHHSLFFAQFHLEIIQFPYILSWGLKADIGFSRNYDVDSLYFVPISFSLIHHLRVIKEFVPFVQWGFSTWNIDFSLDTYSDFYFFWSIGGLISFSLFKQSLRYTMPSEYGIEDIGIIVQMRFHSGDTPALKEKSEYFMKTFHAGLYLTF